ncbi:MAG: diguanylate cyclase [Epsilonproteobacteria bacterium]|nr:diguanylate cyclase [Campylobacterota bacterium]
MINKRYVFNKKEFPLAFKLLLTILISSSLITLVVVAIQLKFDYDADIKLINRRMEQIQKSYVQSIALSVWNFNKAQYKSQISGILTLQDISFVEILSSKGKKIFSKGAYPKERIIIKKYPLKTIDFGKKVNAGVLVVVANLKRVYDDIYKRILFIVVAQGIKTFIISFVILFAFYMMITRYLYRVSDFAKNMSLDSDNKLELNRRRKRYPDELDHIVLALNSMKDKLRKSYKKIIELNKNLEEKVQKRTLKLQELSYKDSLTGAYNRRYCDDISDKIISITQREDKILSVAMIDIDDFKKVNDTYGHDVGDQVLKFLVKTIQKNIRKGDILARYGGEEFIILFSNIRKDEAFLVLNNIRSIIQESILNQKVKFTISIGIADFNPNQTTIKQAIKIADERLYKVKKSGKNRVEIN